MYTREGTFRCFAYVGFNAPEAAAKAIKYYNRNFIDTLRIVVEEAIPVGNGELNRPWSKYSKGSSANDSYLKGKEESSSPSATAAAAELKSQSGIESTNSKEHESLRRKKRLLSSIIDDSDSKELESFVNTSLSKGSTWKNDLGESCVVATASNNASNDATGSDSDESVNEINEFRDVNDETPTPATPTNNDTLSPDLIAETGRLFVRNLSYKCTEDDLRALFERFGTLSEVHLSHSRETRKSKGFAYILFMIPQDALRAFAELDGLTFQGRILHILPSKDRPVADGCSSGDGGVGGGFSATSRSSTNFKATKEKEKETLAMNEYNWNSLFIRSDTVLEAISAKLGVPKSSLMDIHSSSNMAIKMALAETSIIKETKDYLEAEGVDLSPAALQESKRSNKIILVKNLPWDVERIELVRLFEGTKEDLATRKLSRLLLPPTKAVALAEFIDSNDAKAAFRRLAYSKFKNAPLHLEWAPLGLLRDVNSTVDCLNGVNADECCVDNNEKNNENINENNNNHNNDNENNNTTLFVKNLNFSSTKEGLEEVFLAAGAIKSVNIAQRLQNNIPLSMGFGFIEFESKEGLNAALDKMNGVILDGHRLEIKRQQSSQASKDALANKKALLKRRRVDKGKEEDEKNEGNTKLLVRNIPFESTEKEIRELFKSFSAVKRVKLPKRFDGRHRGFGFVDFLTHQEALTARNALEHTHLYGRHLVLEWAELEGAAESGNAVSE